MDADATRAIQGLGKGRMTPDPAGRVALKPCPWCGGEAGSHPDEIGSGGQHVTPYHVGCRRCRMVFSEEEEADAIAAWNTRAADAEIERLRTALESVLIGGNHVALLIGADHPPFTASHDAAMEHYIGRDRRNHNGYDAWCCWRAIMHARSALAPAEGEKG